MLFNRHIPNRRGVRFKVAAMMLKYGLQAAFLQEVHVHGTSS